MTEEFENDAGTADAGAVAFAPPPACGTGVAELSDDENIVDF